MFLITTAEERTWRTDKKVLFLGEWCKNSALKPLWAAMDYDVLPYHWDDRERFAKDFHWLSGIIEDHLRELAASLNRIHSVDYPVRYWRIIIGPWLGEFIQIVFDRYTSIKSAIDSGADATCCMRFHPEYWVPSDMSNFEDWMASDAWNHHVYSEIIKVLGRVSCAEIDGPSAENPAKTRRSLKQLAKKVLAYWDRLIPAKLNKIVIIGSRFQFRDLTRIQLALGQLPYFGMEEKIPVDREVDWEMRSALLPAGVGDGFEAVLRKLLPRHMPIAYLEGYQKTKRCALGAYPASPEAIYTETSWNASEGFKFWAAENTAKGAKLFIGQHGGNYGTALLSLSENHEKSIADRYFTWGWSDDEAKICAMPGGLLISAKRKISPNPRGHILWVGLSLPRYSYWLYSIPLAGQLRIYRDEQVRFLRSLNQDALSEVVMRLFPYDYGWGHRDFYIAAGFGDRLENRRIPFTQALCESKLCVATYNATTFLETLASNFPTIVFWNPHFWELRSSAQPYFDALVDAGILHFSPESAASQVSRIHENPSAWWEQENVQAARRKFIWKFARVGNDWLRDWVDGIRTQLHKDAAHAPE